MNDNNYISQQLLELISAKIINRIQICALLEISQPTLLKRFQDDRWKQWQVDRLTQRYKLIKPCSQDLPCEHMFTVEGKKMVCVKCDFSKDMTNDLK